jgi:hypothetical protein
MIGVMPDTLLRLVGVAYDPNIRFKLTRAAVERAKERHGLRNDEAVWTALGVSRSTFYRLLAGTRAASHVEAAAFAQWIAWPLDRAFKRVTTNV